MSSQRTRNLIRVLAATTGAFLFYSALFAGGGQLELLDDEQPHPGLRDDALKQALRQDWDHDPLSYIKARKAVFGSVDGNGRTAEGIYTGETLRFIGQPLPNKGLMEHAWPMTRLPKTARTDLHHLFAVLPEARAARLNLHYDDVTVAVWTRGGSRSGASKRVQPAFEVRKETRGDIARAMFYVATMYDRSIPYAEEQTLRDWHQSDPVDASERKRNHEVAEHQSSRNPFVSHPNLTERISDF